MRSLTLRALALVLLLLGLAPLAAAKDTSLLKKDDHIIFLGDSITAEGTYAKGYVTLVRLALAEKHKDLKVKVTGAGVSGNKVPDLQNRLARDVLKKKPTLVVIYIGINDVWHGLDNPKRGTPKDKFEAGLKDIIGRIKGEGARVVLCTPTVIGEKPDGSNKGDARLDEYAAISRKVAAATDVPLCDLRKAFIDYLKANNKTGAARDVLTRDTVHLNAAGNKLVADTILKTLGN